MNKIKKIVLSVVCAFFIFPACTIKSNDLKKGALSAVGILVGSYVMVRGGLDIHNAKDREHQDKSSYFNLPQIVVIVKVAAGSIVTALCSKYLIERYLGYKVTFSIGDGDPSYRFKHFGCRVKDSGMNFF